MSLPAIEYPRPAKMELVKEPAPSQPENTRRAFIPAWLDDLDLDPYEFRIYCRIARRGKCTEGVMGMADGCKMGHHKVRDVLASLLEKQLITQTRRQGQTTVYEVSPLPHPAGVPLHNQEGVSVTPSTSGSTPLPHPEDPPLPHPAGKGTPIEGSPSKDKKKESVSARETISADDVERVYQAYPRKVGKQAALKAIKKALKEVTARDGPGGVDWMHERVKIYARCREGQPAKYTPHPSRWFNEGRYDDDEQEWQRSENKQQRQHNTGARINGEDKFIAYERAVADYVASREGH